MTTTLHRQVEEHHPLLYVRKLSPFATLPSRGSEQAAGYDLASARDCTVPARGLAIVDTDVSITVPPGTYGRIAPRSGLAVRHFIDVGAGVIDADYRGNVGVVLFNHSGADFHVRVGDRVAQLILEKVATPEVCEQKEDDEKEQSAAGRGSAGFGSTGV